MSDLRALLLTDLVDSTKLSEKLGDDAMAEVWVGHDRVARDLLPVWRGREIDKTDGMLLLFDAATDAVNYALAYHQALATLPVPLKARAGLHVGPVILRENGPDDVARGAKPLEVDGLAKPTAARVMSLAMGAQTLLTAQAREALGKTELKVESHGHWMIKGVSDPMELFEVGTPQTRMVAPLDSEKVYRVIKAGDWWLPVKDIPNNLPQSGTSFIGREREIDEVKALLTTTRMLTLVGMGGLGKTRLSLQVAAQIIHQYPDGAWFLDLAPISDPALVMNEAAQLLGVREEPERLLIESICAHLKPRRVLLILDNCEHLIKPCADLAHAIVKAAPFVSMLSTSREALHIPGERVYPIMPLPVPKPGDAMNALLRSSAVLLFVERSQAHKPSFELTEREVPAVAELVARLEGIPLALELAAARVRSLSVSDINARLKDRYKILTGGSPVLQQRQQTLRALVDWSYELLQEHEKVLLNRLAVFVGGFDLEASEAICGREPLAGDDVLDLLALLVEKSLVMMEERDEGTRYRMLETIREYASDKLEKSAETSTIAAAHCQHFFSVAKAGRQGLMGEDHARWIRRFESDIDNLRAAMALSLSGAVDVFVAVKFAVAMQGFWWLRGYATEGRSLIHSALALPAIQASELAQAHALYVGANLAGSQSDHATALQMLETCLTLRRRLGNPVDIAATLSTLTPTRLAIGDSVNARAGEEEALQIFRELTDKQGEAIGLLHLGQIELYEGHDAQARARLDRALAVARVINHVEVQGECELVLGQVAMESEDWPQAAQCFTQSLKICQDNGDTRGHAKAMWHLGKNALHGLEFDSARTQLTRAIHVFRKFEMSEELIGCLEDFAQLDQARGQRARSARTLSIASQMRGRAAIVAPDRSKARNLALEVALRSQLPPSDYDAAWAAGQQIEVEAALLTALLS